MIRARKILSLFAALLMLSQSHVFAVGSRGLGNQAIGAYSLGQANAVAARAEDISTNFFNPAGLSHLSGIHLSGGFDLLAPEYSHTSTSGAKEDAKDNSFFVPNLFLGGEVKNTKFSWGLGMTSPFGLATEWSKTGFSKYVATKSELKTLHVNPNVSYRFNEKISAAIGADYMRSDADLQRQVNVFAVNTTLPPFTIDPTTPDGSFQQEGDGDGWGYNLGLMFNPFPNHRLGLAYRSRISMTVDGTAKLSNMSGSMATVFGGSTYSTAGESVLKYPDSTTLGYSINFSEKLTVETDIEWTGWSTFKEQRVTYTQETDPTRLAILNSGNPQSRKWKDVLSLAIGTQYKLNEQWALRGGYLYMDSPVPNETYEPSVPDSDLHGLSIGTGYTVGRVSLDLAYLANFFKSRNVSNNVGAPLSDVDGKYESFSHSLALNATYRF